MTLGQLITFCQLDGRVQRHTKRHVILNDYQPGLERFHITILRRGYELNMLYDTINGEDARLIDAGLIDCRDFSLTRNPSVETIGECLLGRKAWNS